MKPVDFSQPSLSVVLTYHFDDMFSVFQRGVVALTATAQVFSLCNHDGFLIAEWTTAGTQMPRMAWTDFLPVEVNKVRSDDFLSAVAASVCLQQFPWYVISFYVIEKSFASVDDVVEHWCRFFDVH